MDNQDNEELDFYYRVLTLKDVKISAEEIEKFIEDAKLNLTVFGVVEEEDAEELDAEPVEIILVDQNDRQVASLTYESTEDSDILLEELDEFQDFADDMEPKCNRPWVKETLKKVAGCYCFNVFTPGFDDQNWDALATIAGWLREQCDGFEQCDSGQITNLQGQVILIVPDDEDDPDDPMTFEGALFLGGKWLTVDVDSQRKLDDFLKGIA